MISVEKLDKFSGLIARAVREVAGLGEDVIDDLVQDTLVQAIEHIQAGEEVTPSWLFLRAQSRAKNHMRLADNNNVSLDDKLTDSEGHELDSIPPSLWDLDTPEGLYAAREFIEGASDEDREIIELLVEGNTQFEIACELEVSQQTISNRINKMKESLS